MEDWYQQQEFCNEVRLSRIKAWIAQEVIDIFVYNDDMTVPRFAVG
jgi:hypothetical protein